MNPPILGYKYARHGAERVVVTLEIPADSHHTMHRPKILNPKMASYLTDRAKVISIEDSQGNPVPDAISCRWPETLTYKVGEVVIDPRANFLEGGPCGISFYGSKERIVWESNHYNGINKIYGENGWLTMEYLMKDGEILHESIHTFTRYDGEEGDQSDYMIRIVPPEKNLKRGVA